MFVLFLLYIPFIAGLSSKRYGMKLCSIWPKKLDNGIPTRKYSKTLREIPLFIVEAKYSNPIVLNVNGEQVVSVFVDPNDAIEFITEIYQAEPSDSNIDSGLRIRLTNLYEWLEIVDPNIPRVSSKPKFQLVPSAAQITNAYAYMPLAAKKELLVPLFYSKNTTSSFKCNNSNTPLFLEYTDLLKSIAALEDKVQRELAIKSIGVVSLIDLLLCDPALEEHTIVPSSSSLDFCRRERFSLDSKSRELDSLT